MGRVYYVSTGEQTLSAVQDVLEVTSGDDNPFRVLEVWFSMDETVVVSHLIEYIRATSGFTSGSGGGTATVNKGNDSDAADSLAGHERNNTTQAVAGGGSLQTLHGAYFKGIAPLIWTPPKDLWFAGGDAFIVACQDTPAGNATATVAIEEI